MRTAQLTSLGISMPFACFLLAGVLVGCAGASDEEGTGGPEGGEGSVDADRRSSGATFVHLFEWTWTDIARECEEFLGPKGFAAVQISPPNEHILHDAWWARYEPVSHRLTSRSGTREEFIEMVERCNAAGVAIYADLVINHTAAYGNGGVGVDGTAWSIKNHPSFPEYRPEHYHSSCAITNYQDVRNVQQCELLGLPDLNTSHAYVQGQIAGYIQDLLDIGVAGFHVHAAKHIARQDLSEILAMVGNPLVFLEVSSAADEAVQPELYTELGQVTEFAYAAELAEQFLGGQIHGLYAIAEGKLRSERAIVFTETHESQRMEGSAGPSVTHTDSSLYHLANTFMLAWPYGYPRIMSSYHVTDADAGPPLSRGGCENPAFVCEHRWPSIANMVGFRKFTSGEAVAHWWDDGANRIAFSRGDKGFVALNNQDAEMDETLQTGLPEGVYCNIASGGVVGDSCTGTSVSVAGDGLARIVVPAFEAVAIHVGTRIADRVESIESVAVTFTCLAGETYVGQSVYVVGSGPELGDWQLAQAVKLEPTSYPTWSGTLTLPSNTRIEWKCVKREEADPDAGIVWQPGDNNVLTTPATGMAIASASF